MRCLGFELIKRGAVTNGIVVSQFRQQLWYPVGHQRFIHPGERIAEDTATRSSGRLLPSRLPRPRRVPVRAVAMWTDLRQHATVRLFRRPLVLATIADTNSYALCG